MNTSLQTTNDLFCGAVTEDLRTFRTDLHGIRIRKFEQIIKVAQKLKPVWVERSLDHLDLNIHGIHVHVERSGQDVYLTLGTQTIKVDEKDIYDTLGNKTTPTTISPRFIRSMLVS